MTDASVPKFDKQKYHRHLRGWFSYAFARWVCHIYEQLPQRVTGVHQ